MRALALGPDLPACRLRRRRIAVAPGCSPAGWRTLSRRLVDGLLQGQGRIDYPNGSWYAGQFDKGQWHGQGEWHGSNGEVYRGQFQQGLFDGQGSLTTNASSYTGGFKQGRRDGEGTLKENAMTYRGEFKADQYSGLGRLEMDDGSQYQGQFAHGKPNGEGQRNDSAATQFTGNFVNGQLEGTGTFNSADGDSHVGGFQEQPVQWSGPLRKRRWRRLARAVQGRRVDRQGRADRLRRQRAIMGDFNDWRFSGSGSLNLPDGSLYIGGFDNDNYHGSGTWC